MNHASISAEQQDEMVGLFQDGLTYRQIADRLNCPLSMVASAMCALGISRSNLREQYRKVYDMWVQGHTKAEIASATGYGEDFVVTVLNKQNALRRGGQG
jgi:DNA-binding CsgD family transcriptional regulator